MKIAVVGASGLVGRKILCSLKDQGNEIYAYASKKSAGKIIEGIKVQKLSIFKIKKCDFAIFSAGSEISKKFAPLFARKGAYVIDNSNAFRREENVPLIVPEVNFEQFNKSTRIIANPNCSTIQIALALYYINKIYKIKRVVISTYQSASGAGQKGIEDLENKTSKKFDHPLYDNLLAKIDKALENGYTLEEDKMIFELKKILSLPELLVTATAVRVPIHYCHGASVNVEFFDKISLEKIRETLGKSKGIVLLDDLQKNIYPEPRTAKNTDSVYVGRLRRDFSLENGINFFVVADNLRKGASTNAIQIMNKIRGIE